MPLHHVKALLGHASVATTDIYLNAGRIHLRESMERAEARKSGKEVANSDTVIAGQTVSQEAGRVGKSLVS